MKYFVTGEPLPKDPSRVYLKTCYDYQFDSLEWKTKRIEYTETRVDKVGKFELPVERKLVTVSVTQEEFDTIDFKTIKDRPSASKRNHAL